MTKLSKSKLPAAQQFILRPQLNETTFPIGPMKLSEVTNSALAQAWLEVPRYIYKDDKNWIPYIKQDVASIFDPKKNKLFREGQAKRWNLYNNEGLAIGRIAAFISKKYCDGQKQPTGGIGFFECIDDAAAARLLLETASDWLKHQGMEAVDGPINFGEKEAYWGLLVENFTDMSSFRMNYNPPYYQRFFEDFGFKTFYEQICYKRDMFVPAQEVFVRKSETLMSSGEFSVRNMRGKSTSEIAEAFVTVYNNAWAGHLGFKKMQLQQAQRIIQSMKQVMDKDILIFAYHHDKPIGFYINLPEVNEFMQHVNGNLNAWGILKFLYHKWFSPRQVMVGLVFGVDRDYHGRGVEGAMIKFCEQNVVPMKRYKETILTWIGDFNPKMIHVAENLGAKPYRKLITYRKFFDESAIFERHPILK